ncbi:MAG: CotH kinase family protein [Phycisphaerae bacterium]|nr:CotH kinase family protein [Phycisphaerae bacterium]
MRRNPLGTWVFVATAVSMLASVGPGQADEADVIFDDTQVLVYELTFTQPDWWDQLVANYEDPEQPYMEAHFQFGDEIIDPIGVRLKGNSSYWGYPGDKKSFKLKFDEYDEQQTFYGLKKTNLNNGFKDPTLLREKLFLDFLNSHVPAIRANHVALYINGTYWGLYTQVEQVDKTFFQKHIGPNEDGNLFKGDPHGTLEWLGPDPEPYKNGYELKTNETEDDWTDLINLIDVLNNTPGPDFQAAFDAVFEVSNYLETLAANILFVNLDSYNGTGHNYYVYHREDNDKFIHFAWDCNEAFGNFNYGMSPQQVLTMDVHWLPQSPPPPQPPSSWPLCERLWQTFDWDREYLRHLAAMLRSDFNSATQDPRIDELADMIRPYVYADTKKMYTNAQFEQNLELDIQDGPFTIIGLKRFVAERSVFMDNRLNDFSSRSDLALNEIMSVNVGTIQDGAGDYDPWLEIYNRGPGRVYIQNVFLTDDPGNPTKWALPIIDIEDGDFILLWLDGEPGEGTDHANFTLQPGGGELHLYKNPYPSSELIDSVTYPALGADESFGRFPDGDGVWQNMNNPTPGGPNQENDEPVVLFINEFMADNESTIEDPDDPGAFDDWLEIYNPNDVLVDLSGMYLTDDLANPTKWQVPVGVAIEPDGHLLFWADEDEEQGDTHTNFKLGAGGEEIGLFDNDGTTQIDVIVFGEQYADVSYGRYPDGSDNWGFMTSPTPGWTNDPHNAPPTISGTAHAPASPTAADPVWVTATVTDDGGVTDVTMTYDAGGGPQIVTMHDDGNHQDGGAGDDIYGGQIPAFPQDTVVNYYITATDNLGAEATDPADAPTVTYSYVVGYALPPLYINEFMADNDNVIEDPDEPGEFPDWLELYNAGDVTIDIGGMYLTDELAVPTQYQIPAGVSIPAGGFLIFWADDDDEQGPLHTNFKLGASGEEIGLYDTDANGNVAIDTLSFGAQTMDVSYGRVPDGGPNWEFFDYSTPGDSNALAGDCNCDDYVTWRDIDYFIAAMNDNVAAWEAMFLPAAPTCSFWNCDVNADGTVSWRDIDPFVAAMN